MNTPTNAPLKLWQKVVLILGGTACGLVLAVAVLLLLVDTIITVDPASREYAGQTLSIQFREHDGDMFWVLPGQVRPPEGNQLLTEYTITWDEDGFRVPHMLADHYPIAVYGDSFTEGANVAMPWTDLLAQNLDLPVRNYGYRGYGPFEIRATVEEFLNEDDRQWVLYAHFSGNDFSEILRPDADLVDERNPFFKLPFVLEQATNNINARLQVNPDGNYNYPMPVIIGGQYYEMAFLDMYFWWQRPPMEGFAGSEPLVVIAETLDFITQNVGDETCRALVFMPTKEQLYYPYVHDNVRQYLRQNATRPAYFDGNRLGLSSAPFTEDEEADIIAELSGQRDAIRHLAEEHDWLFIDLLAPFEARVADGKLLYYRFDTHWNQEGHHLVADIITDFIQQTDNCTDTAS